MKISKAKQLLDRVGIKENTREIQILSRMLELSQIPTSPMTFREILDYINSEREKEGDKPFSRGWVSNCLNSLVDRGFVHKDSLGRPYKYTITLETMVGGIDRAIEQYLSKQDEKINEIQMKLAHLRSIDPLLLSRQLYRSLSGSEYVSPGGIDGIVGVRNTIISGILDLAKENDVIRVFGHHSYFQRSLEFGPIQKQLIEVANRGVETKVFLSHLESKNNLVKSIKEKIGSYEKDLEHSLRSNKLQIRFHPESIRTYRGIILNDTRMMLILSDKQKPDSGVFITHESNSPLITSAISTFDRLWSQSKPIDLL